MSDIGEANRKHWDGRAADYDAKPWQRQVISYISGALASHRPLFDIHDERQDFRLLDYACGPGTVTRALLPYVKEVRGIDVSDGMVEEYNRRFADDVGKGKSARAVQGNLLADTAYLTDGEPKEQITDFEEMERFNGFDAVIVGLGFHHFSDWTGSLRTLGRRVKKGGLVGIIDLLPSEEHWTEVSEEMRKMMHKSGFTREEMEKYMSEAGLVDFEMVELPEPVVMMSKEKEIKRHVFFARGRTV